MKGKLIIIFASFALLWAGLPASKSVQSEKFIAKNPVSQNIEWNQRTVDRVDTTTIFFDDFEGDVSDWALDSGWVLSDQSSSSPTHSFNYDDGNYEMTTSMTSPTIALPDLTSENEVLKFNFDLWCDMPDSDGDGDNFLEDYYWIDISNLDDVPLYFHASTDNAYDGNSWWGADATIGGYADAWLQFLDTPVITVPASGGTMTAQMKWDVEDPAGASVAGTCTNGWDAANVRISTDGGSTWSLLTGDDPYDFTDGYGWIYNDEAYYDCQEIAAGWGGNQDWHLVTFDLAAYASQDVIIRFGFGSDPSYSTVDDPSITGLRVDDVSVVDGDSNSLFFDNADDQATMTPANGFDFQWVQAFYDYGDITRPGGAGWVTYMPGDPFNGNVQLDISDLAGANVKFRFTARADADDDGGDGEGLYVDDFHVWSVSLEEGIPVVQNVVAVAGDAMVDVSWENPSADFGGLVQYDDSGFENEINMTTGTAIMGTHFDAPYGVESVTVNNAYVFGGDNAGSTTLYGYEMGLQGPNETHLYSTTITTVTGQWLEVPVGWVFSGDFIIAFEVSLTIGVALDENSSPSSQSWANLGGWSTWADVAAANGLPDGEWGIRADVTSTGGADAEYNVYRSVDGGVFNLMFNGQGITATEYHDVLVQNGLEYCYEITAVYGTSEGDPAAEACAVPESNTVYEIVYDDDNANTSFNVADGNMLAVRFTPTVYPSQLFRVKYYTEANGVALAQVWDDDGTAGLPGTVLLSNVVVQLGTGWTEKNVSSYDVTITDGDFYVGWVEMAQTPPIGVDTDSPGDRSVVDIGMGSGWEPFETYFSGAIMIRVDMDGFTGVGDELSPDLPESFGLAQNYPNPFNPVTNIEFDIAEQSITKLSVFDLTGREVKTLINKNLAPGHYRYQLNASQFASGMYIYRIEALSGSTGKLFQDTRKLVLMK